MRTALASRIDLREPSDQGFGLERVCRSRENQLRNSCATFFSFVVRSARYVVLQSRRTDDLAARATVLTACGEIPNSILVDVGCTLVVQTHTLVWVGVAGVATTSVSRVARVRSVPGSPGRSRAEVLASRDLPTCRWRGRINRPPSASRRAPCRIRRADIHCRGEQHGSPPTSARQSGIRNYLARDWVTFELGARQKGATARADQAGRS